MTSRSATRDAALRLGAAVTSAAAVLALAGTGAALGLLARPEPLVPQADPAPEPRPKRTVYVRVPTRAQVQSPARRALLQPPPRAPRRAVAPPVTTSSAS